MSEIQRAKEVEPSKTSYKSQHIGYSVGVILAFFLYLILSAIFSYWLVNRKPPLN